MKKVFESNLVGFDESAERLTIFEIESEKESKELFEKTYDELCELFNVEDDYNVPAGAEYHRYRISVHSSFVILAETVALNV